MRSGWHWSVASTGLDRSRVLGLAAAVVLAACGDDSAEVRDPGIDEATLADAPADTLEGLLRVGQGGLTFRVCGSTEDAWVIEGDGADLREAADGLSVGAGSPMLARVIGGEIGASGEEQGTPFERVVYVRQWVYLAENTSGCVGVEPEAAGDLSPTREAGPEGEGEGMPVLPAGVMLRALGNEPFWHADIGENVVRLTRIGLEELGFPVSGPELVGDSRRWVAESGEHRFELVVEDGPCADTMADRTYPYSARLTLDGEEYNGCALEPPGGS